MDTLTILFTNHTGNPLGDYVKTEMYLLPICSGLLLLLFKPQFLLMLIPVFIQKLFHDNYVVWSIDAQYNIEFAPIMAIGIFSVIAAFQKKPIRQMAMALVLIGTLASTIRIMDNTVIYTDKSKIRIYQSSHYSRHYKVSGAYQMLSAIPEDAVVSAQSPFLPHLALRDKVYQFPMIKDAEYIVFSRLEGTYPLKQDDFDILTTGLERFSNWETVQSHESMTILKKKP
jgi:uncharacterized membrane protein